MIRVGSLKKLLDKVPDNAMVTIDGVDEIVITLWRDIKPGRERGRYTYRSAIIKTGIDLENEELNDNFKGIKKF